MGIERETETERGRERDVDIKIQEKKELEKDIRGINKSVLSSDLGVMTGIRGSLAPVYGSKCVTDLKS